MCSEYWCGGVFNLNLQNLCREIMCLGCDCCGTVEINIKVIDLFRLL